MNRRAWPGLIVLLVVGLALAGACDRKRADGEPGDREKAAEESEPADKEQAAGGQEQKQGEKQQEDDEQQPAAVEPVEGWEELDEEELSAEDRGRLDRARSAQKKLGKNLIGELNEAIGEDGHVGAVEVCNERAPEIAADIRDETDVEVGRTSFRLRNPDNKPREWAEPYVDERVDDTRVLRSDDDELAYLAPIELQEMCAGCHGPSDELADGVSDKIDELYPEDEATGFEPGELRGWFWVEVDG